MSYLPRLSSTYKEPQAMNQDDSEETKHTNIIQPASSLANEKNYSPQTALKHYKYYPHPLPVLPGPSVIDEANENELLRESSKMKRSTSLINDLNLNPSQSEITITSKTTDSSKMLINGSRALLNEENSLPVTSTNQLEKHRISFSENKISVLDSENKKKPSNQTINICLVQTDVPKSFVEPQKLQNSTKKEVLSSEFLAESHLSDSQNKNNINSKTFSNLFKNMGPDVIYSKKNQARIHRGVQCAIFGRAEKIFVIPSVIKTLLKTLAFIFYEINKDEILYCFSIEGKKILTQVQLILDDLCNQDVNESFRFDVTYSDLKRVEKLLEELKKFIKLTYETNGIFLDVSEKLKILFFELKIKELELNFLYDQIHEKEFFRMTENEIIENQLKNPEVILQNKKLECEQLLAQVEFSKIEIKKHQKALAEADWKIKNGHVRMKNLKKSWGSKFRIDNMRRKSSVQKFFLESPRKTTKSKDFENGRLKKNI